MHLSNKALYRIARFLKLQEFDGYLYHTTSRRSLQYILRSEEITPRPDGYVSFGESPFSKAALWGTSEHGPLKGSACIQVSVPDGVEKVEYTVEWFINHLPQAQYIEDEGFIEDEDLELDLDYILENFIEQDESGSLSIKEGTSLYYGYESFFEKSNEEEWISMERGQPVLVEIIDVLR